MNDLQNMIMMLSKSDEEFRKYRSGDDWKIQLSKVEVFIVFDKDGNFLYMGHML
jgi:hypothetical protein